MSFFNIQDSREKYKKNYSICPNIGLFGGSFNPIHLGHLALAQNALISLKLSSIIFIPTYVSPFKVGFVKPQKEHILNMISLAIETEKKFILSDYEIKTEEISYTINTIKYFKTLIPMANFVLLLGADSFEKLDKWKDIDELITLVDVAVFNRGKAKINAPKGVIDFKVIEGNTLDISSTNIRDRVKNNFPIKGLVPDSVEDYIYNNGLYQPIV